MGQAQCCNVSIARKRSSMARKDSQLPRAVTELQGVKPLSEFKIAYDDKGPVDRGKTKVTTVVSKDTYGQYVCRKLKISDMPCTSKDERSRHYQTLANVEHPHICKFVEAFEDKDHAYLIYEKADMMTLFDHVRCRRSLTEEEAADYVRQVTSALAVAHNSGIVHGRLNPRSLILTPGFEEAEEDNCEVQLKVCDFGQGYVLRKPIMSEEGSGSDKSMDVMKYAIAPEMAMQDFELVAEGNLAPKGAVQSDMWALGVIVYHMLSGRVPFEAVNKEALENKITNSFASFDSDMWKKLSSTARDCVAGLLKVNPGIRMTAQALLKHPWIKVAKQSFPRVRMEKLLNNLKTNANECEFKKFVLRVIAEHLPPEGKQAAVVESAFRCLDRNGDGVLTVEEIIKGLKKHMDCSSQELLQLFEAVDRDGSGTLNVNEFISVTMDQNQTTSMPVLWQAFNAFDRDQGGEISFDEIERIVKEVEGALLGKDQVQKLSEDILHELEGVSHDGTIDFDQFVYIMKNSKPNAQDAFKKDWGRMLWNRCGMDIHDVRKGPTTWSLSQKALNPRSGRSVYRKRNSYKRRVSENIKGKVDASPRNSSKSVVARAG